jgi:hypothetical protein
LQLALALRPETKKVVVIAGVSDWDKYWLARVKPGLAQFEDKLAFSYLLGLTVAEQQQALAALSRTRSCCSSQALKIMRETSTATLRYSVR